MARECRTDFRPKSQTRSLTLENCMAAFFILGIGLATSAVAFLSEILTGRLIHGAIENRKTQTITRVIRIKQ